MITFECPWCAEPTDLEATGLDELTCEACGIAVEIASDPVHVSLDRAA